MYQLWMACTQTNHSQLSEYISIWLTGYVHMYLSKNFGILGILTVTSLWYLFYGLFQVFVESYNPDNAEKVPIQHLEKMEQQIK